MNICNRPLKYALALSMLLCALPNDATSSKRQLLQNICCGIGCLGNITSQGFNCVCGKLNEIIALLNISTHCATIVYPSSFGTTGYTITQPGYYILCGDVAFAPTAATSALTIASTYGHVTFDFNEHSIYQTNATALVNGINIYKINTSLHDIEIKNGSISGFSLYGIYAHPTAAYPAYNIKLENLTVENSNNSNLFFDGRGGAEVRDCYISNCLFTKSRLGAGIYLDYCTDFIVKDSNFTRNNTQGALVIDSAKCNFSNCTFNDNTIYGTGIDDSIALLFDTCTFHSNTSYGMYLTGTGCEVIDSKAIATSGISVAYGFYIDGHGNNIINCSAKENATTTYDAGGVGFVITGTNIHIQDCYSFSNSGYGFYNNGSGTLITGCIAGNNTTANYAGATVAQNPNCVDINPLGGNTTVNDFANVALQSNPCL